MNRTEMKYVVLQTGCKLDEERFRKDIIRPEAA